METKKNMSPKGTFLLLHQKHGVKTEVWHDAYGYEVEVCYNDKTIVINDNKADVIMEIHDLIEGLKSAQRELRRIKS